GPQPSSVRAVFRRGGRARCQPQRHAPEPQPNHHQSVSRRDGRRADLERRRADPGGDQRALAPGFRLPAAGPLRSHPVRAAARRGGAAILRIQTAGKPVQDIDYDFLAKKTDQFSGADLKAVVDTAIEGKLREAMKAGLPKPLTTKDLQNAAASIKPTTREWF